MFVCFLIHALIPRSLKQWDYGAGFSHGGSVVGLPPERVSRKTEWTWNLHLRYFLHMSSLCLHDLFCLTAPESPWQRTWKCLCWGFTATASCTMPPSFHEARFQHCCPSAWGQAGRLAQLSSLWTTFLMVQAELSTFLLAISWIPLCISSQWSRPFTCVTKFIPVICNAGWEGEGFKESKGTFLHLDCSWLLASYTPSSTVGLRVKVQCLGTLNASEYHMLYMWCFLLRLFGLCLLLWHYPRIILRPSPCRRSLCPCGSVSCVLVLVLSAGRWPASASSIWNCLGVVPSPAHQCWVGYQAFCNLMTVVPGWRYLLKTRQAFLLCSVPCATY